MPNVLNEFAGDGVTTSFNFSMTGGYLSRDYVFFYTRPNEDLLAYTPYDDDAVTWIGDFTVQTASPIPVGTTFVILRSTTLEPLVDFQNTSRITEKNLDTATWQGVHIAAENSDLVGRIKVVAQDAKDEAEQAMADADAAAADALAAATAAIAAQVAAQAAQVSAVQAGVDAMDAAASAAIAESVANAAAATANAAETTANAAAATASAASANAAAAVSTANTATTTANAASTAASGAVTTANAASTAASNAVTTANTADATANNALTIANAAKGLIDEAVSGAVVSFNGRAGVVTAQSGDYTKDQVGLGNVDNTADVDKPISTAQSNAIGLKADLSYVNTQLGLKADATATTNALALKADKTYVDTQSTADRDRANHTGTQAISTVSGLQAELNNPTAVASINGGQLGATRNIFHNGALIVWQRGTGPFALTDGSAVCLADRWSVTRVGSGTTNFQQDTDVPPNTGLVESMTLTATAAHTVAANNAIAISQSIEGYDARRMYGKTFTVSFWVKAVRTGTYGVSIRSPLATKSYILTYNVAAANTWQQVSLTVAGGIPSDAAFNSWLSGRGVEIMFGVNVGSNFKSPSNGSWLTGNYIGPSTQVQGLLSNADTFKLAGLQLETGSVATAFEHVLAAAELNRCQRYHQMVNLTIAAGTGLTGDIGTGYALPVMMRATPTATLVGSQFWIANGVAGARTLQVTDRYVASSVTVTGAQAQYSDVYRLSAEI